MFIKLAGSVRSYLRARDAMLALDGMSDAALDDIGLTRAGLANPYPEPGRREATVTAGSLFAMPLPCQIAAQAA